MNQYQRPRSKFELAHDNFVFDEWPFYNMSRLISIYHRRLDAVLKPIGIDTPFWESAGPRPSRRSQMKPRP